MYRYGKLVHIGAEIPEGDDVSPFVVDGVLHRSTTLIFGQTGAGKSTVAASIAMAVAGTESEWLGQPVTRHGHALIVAGDPDGEREYRQRLTNGRDQDIDVYAPNRPAIPETWSEVAMIARQCDSTLVVIDNLSAFVPGTLNDDFAIKQFYFQTDNIARDGAAVLIVAHTSEKTGEHGPSTKPMGSSYIRFGPRWSCYAHKSRGALVLDFDGNDGQPWALHVSEPNGKPQDLALRERIGADELADRRARRSRQRTDDRKNRSDGIRDFILAQCQQMNGKEAAEAIAAQFGGSVSSYQSQLSRKSLGVKAIAGGGWESLRHAD